MSRSTRRQQGIVRNLANQMAQMATGWEISFDGPSLLEEPDTGVITVDVVERSAVVNGKPVKLRITEALRHWVDQELRRQQLGWDWLQIARVTIRYSRSTTPFPETKYELSAGWKPLSDHGVFDALAEVPTARGEADSSSHNNQPLLRVRDRPVGSTDQPSADVEA